MVQKFFLRDTNTKDVHRFMQILRVSGIGKIKTPLDNLQMKVGEED